MQDDKSVDVGAVIPEQYLVAYRANNVCELDPILLKCCMSLAAATSALGGALLIFRKHLEVKAEPELCAVGDTCPSDLRSVVSKGLAISLLKKLISFDCSCAIPPIHYFSPLR